MNETPSYWHSLALKLYPYAWALSYFSAFCYAWELWGAEKMSYPLWFSQAFFSLGISLGTVLLVIRFYELFYNATPQKQE